ncbi:hypothetical protein K458DRAFT_129698 [Lentithecium fluviatile CBS 122367]|uniref:GmrSD restriction endonucleases N-terminal domain-containing protein n=1 Tax=Lentithecium fluviatile CBS 122367 TaxID=1168545 RepID=A0A6G1JHD3_9PLEO|nr:hypothetical protein K458DRAFT_129698 [Lentithecium fluviatile CBS 122367]
MAPDQPAVKSEAEEPDDFLLNDEPLEGDGSYKSRPQLSKPGTFLRTLSYLMNALDAGDIDVDPEYQREVVWTADRMTGLVDSLMGMLCASCGHSRLTSVENFYVPPIILNKKPRDTKNGAPPKHKLVCVDGKQRLSSVRAFIKGIIPCHDHRGEKWWFCITRDTPGGRNKKTLPENMKKEFLDKEFVSFEYADLSQEQEEDLFARVQMGVQLTLAEKMRASTGPWQDLARCYVEDFPVIYSLLKDRARAKDFQMTLSCFSQIVEVQHPTAANGIPTLKTNHSHLPKLLENKGAVDDGIKSHLASVWNTFQDLVELDPNTFTNADRRLRGVQTFAPIEMVAVAVLISMYSESRNNRLLIGDIQALREALRENFVDLRLNIQTWKWIWEFIENLEQIRGAVDGTTVDRSVNTTPALARRSLPAPAAPTPPPVKRGRPTARTKPVAVLPGSSKHITTERAVATPPPDPRPPKRPRVGSVPSTAPGRSALSSPVNTIGSSCAISSSKDTSDSDVKFLGSRSRPTSVTLPAQSPPIRTLANPGASAQKAQGTRTQVNSRPVVSPAAALPPATASSTAPPRPSLVNPSDTRQNRISELNSYRAPIAPMTSLGSTWQPSTAPTPTAPMRLASWEGYMPTSLDTLSSLWALPTRAMPPPQNTPATSSPTFPTHTPPIPSLTTQPPTTSPFFASGPIRTPSPKPQEMLHSISPTVPRRSPPFQAGPAPRSPTVPDTSPAPSQARPAPKPRPSVPARSLPQYDGAIDLTGDDEDIDKERQRLLTQFRASASIGNPARSSTSHSLHGRLGPHPLPPPVGKPPRRNSVVEDLTEEEPVEYNNPYQRRKQQASASGL